MRIPPFRFFAAESTEHALGLLTEHGDEARLLAGGITLVPLMRQGLVRPTAVVSLTRLRDLRGVRRRAANGGSALSIGPLTTHEDLERSPDCALLAASASGIGDVQVRHRGTLGGSLGSGDPSANHVPVLAVLDARLHLASARGERAVPVRTIGTAPDARIGEGELLVDIEVPQPPAGSGQAFAGLSRVKGSPPIVNAAAIARRERVSVAVGGASMTPLVVEVESASRPADDVAAEVRGHMWDACAEPLEHPMAPGDYRRDMAAVFAERACRTAMARLSEGEAQ